VIRKHALRLFGLISILALAAVLVAGCSRGGGGFGKGASGGPVVAKVDGKPITQGQLCEALELSDNGNAGRQALESLIIRQLIRGEAEKRGIKIDPKELEARVEGLKDYILAGTGKSYEAWLSDTGQASQDIADRVTVQMLTARLVLTDQDRQRYFDSNKERLKDIPHNNDSVIYRQIVVATKSEADAIRNELMKAAGGKPVTNEQFGKIAEERSLDPMTRTRGGMRGWWIKGKGSGMGDAPNAELEKALFTLKPGELSQPMAFARPMPPMPKGQTPPKQPDQWQLLMVDERITPHPIALQDNQDVIEDWMLNDPTYQFQLQQFFENLRSKAKIEVLAPRYKPVEDEYRKRAEAKAKMQQQSPGMAMPQGQAPGGPMPQAPQGQASPGGQAGGR
jgi:parvulin-like peptidyl-prolyl isomerase